MSKQNNHQKAGTSYERKPIRKIQVRSSKDGAHIIFDDITTWIFPKNYLAKVIENAGSGTVSKKQQADSNLALGERS